MGIPEKRFPQEHRRKRYASHTSSTLAVANSVSSGVWWNGIPPTLHIADRKPSSSSRLQRQRSEAIHQFCRSGKCPMKDFDFLEPLRMSSQLYWTRSGGRQLLLYATVNMTTQRLWHHYSHYELKKHHMRMVSVLVSHTNCGQKQHGVEMSSWK